MTCMIGKTNLATPLVRMEVERSCGIGIRAGDIMLATESPRGLSAPNIIPGTIKIVSSGMDLVSAVSIARARDLKYI